jgi:hypothetical protein
MKTYEAVTIRAGVDIVNNVPLSTVLLRFAPFVSSLGLSTLVDSARGERGEDTVDLGSTEGTYTSCSTSRLPIL